MLRIMEKYLFLFMVKIYLKVSVYAELEKQKELVGITTSSF
ncbi:hypothetical protein BTH41_01094 [Bacillus mycoides]|nr:hypothetical protein BTH41_01094 [Bacillus mycoides]